jgi:hypothetical protein
MLEGVKISHENGMQDLHSQECWIILVHHYSGVAALFQYISIYFNAVLPLCNIGFTDAPFESF